MQHLIFYRKRGPGFAAALDSVDRQWFEPKTEIGAIMPGPAPHRWMLYYQERIFLQDHPTIMPFWDKINVEQLNGGVA